jgi:hypothetical protein
VLPRRQHRRGAGGADRGRALRLRGAAHGGELPRPLHRREGRRRRQRRAPPLQGLTRFGPSVHFGVLAFSVAVVWGFAVAAVPVLIGVRVILVVQLEVVLSTSAISKIISYFWNFGWVRIERFARDQ